MDWALAWSTPDYTGTPSLPIYSSSADGKIDLSYKQVSRLEEIWCSSWRLVVWQPCHADPPDYNHKQQKEDKDKASAQSNRDNIIYWVVVLGCYGVARKKELILCHFNLRTTPSNFVMLFLNQLCATHKIHKDCAYQFKFYDLDEATPLHRSEHLGIINIKYLFCTLFHCHNTLTLTVSTIFNQHLMNFRVYPPSQ